MTKSITMGDNEREFLILLSPIVSLSHPTISHCLLLYPDVSCCLPLSPAQQAPVMRTNQAAAVAAAVAAAGVTDSSSVYMMMEHSTYNSPQLAFIIAVLLLYHNTPYQW